VAAFDLTASQVRAQARLRGDARRRPSGEATTSDCRLRLRDLPIELKDALFNLETDGEDATIAADVVAFYAFNHVAPRALSFASRLPLVALERGEQRSGWRPKSRALLQAVLRYRGDK
jgi:hypothetical protein